MAAGHDDGWDEEVRAGIAGRHEDGLAGLDAYLEGLPGAYRQLTRPSDAAQDWTEVTRLLAEDGVAGLAGGAALGDRYRLAVRPSDDAACNFRLRRFATSGMELTSGLPLLESFGLVVVEAVPFRLRGPGGEELHVDDIGVRTESPYGPEALRFVPQVHGPRLVEAIAASAGGRADVDSLNRLVTTAGLDWAQVTVLRAYSRYWRQVAADLSREDLAGPLVRYPDVARALVAYFAARFDPSTPRAESPGEPGAAERALCTAQLDLVTGLDDDRVLRALLGLVDATWRTNRYVPGRAGSEQAPRPLVLKMDSRRVPELAPPRPRVDTFVHGPTVEGVHLRAGLIARGGIRWSERPADFRTEILDLAFAQVKKNAIIVPTGAKGGFVVRTLQVPGGPGRPERPDPTRVRSAYASFVQALLEITDNLLAGEVVRPPGVVAWDLPDPYLVVAADKGTATFSDLANSISERAGFWLGDAFASGGSSGYDHKAMGITARGAWVSVRRHFREVGVDVATEPIRVVGVGDMSGDVFGNGMLQSAGIRLVGAFDHRHVFLDPEPDPARSFEERQRLAGMERSSWADYRPEAISAGGGVWARDLKSVPLSPDAQRVLGVSEPELSPPRLVSAILAAPVDLIWFGGIGTFIKAPGEADSEVGDHANDAVRITTDRVRARVIAEGANLGVTQRGRIRYSRRGGRINADFIDNAAGVATSDREVNLKILLGLAMERGRLDRAERDAVLARATEEVAADVLRQVDHSVAALNRAARCSERDLDAYEALIDRLESAGRFDRQVEVLPDGDELGVRRQAGAGLIRPELATLLAYAKADVVEAIEASDRARDPVFLDSVVPYFPSEIRDRFGDLVPEHRLYPQLVATDVAGEIVDQMGIVWAHDAAAETGRGLDEVAAAFWVARRLTGAGSLWAELEAMTAGETPPVDAPAEAALHQAVVDAVAELVRSYLRRNGPFEAGRALERDTPAAAGAVTIPVPPARAGIPERSALGVDPETADRFSLPARRVAAIGAARVAAAAGRSLPDARLAQDLVGRAAGLERLQAMAVSAFEGSPPPGRVRVWQARAVLDDLADWRDRAAAQVLAEGGRHGSGGDPAVAAEAWSEMRSRLLERAASLAGSAPDGADPLAVATLALRRLDQALDP